MYLTWNWTKKRKHKHLIKLIFYQDKNTYLSTATLMMKIRERNYERSLAIVEKEKRNRKI